MPVRTKRIYEAPSHDDGYRVLIDGIWTRGITRERAAVDEWARELAPSTQLRRWYGHEPDRFKEFAGRYRAELGAQRERLSELRRCGRASSRWSSQHATPSTATRPCSATCCTAAWR